MPKPTGLAVDFQTAVVQLTLLPTPPSPAATAFSQAPEYAWLLEHAHEYGFILRYPAEKVAITGMDFQPYHFRYVGAEHAALIRQNNLCLEEYLGLKPPAIEGDDSGSTAPPADSNADSGTGSGSGDDSGSGQMG